MSSTGRPWPVVLTGAALVAMITASCGQAASEADVTRLDTDGVLSLSSELASCVGDGLGVEVPEDFLLEPGGQAFDLGQATPEQEQAVAECFRRVRGGPAPDPPAPPGADGSVLEVDASSGR